MTRGPLPIRPIMLPKPSMRTWSNPTFFISRLMTWMTFSSLEEKEGVRTRSARKRTVSFSSALALC